MGPLADQMSAEAGADLLCQAFALGVTFWDTSDDYGTHPHVARALRQVPRAQVAVASKTREPEGATGRILAELGTDYLDVLFIHDVALDWIEPARQALQTLWPDRERGCLRALGLSTHSAEVARRAAQWPEVEVLMVPLNRTGVCTSDSRIEDGGVAEMLTAARTAAEEEGKGVIAMKVYGCGALSGEGKSALAFAAGLPSVHSLCVGIRSTEDLQRNVDWLAEIEGAGPAPSAPGQVVADRPLGEV